MNLPNRIIFDGKKVVAFEGEKRPKKIERIITDDYLSDKLDLSKKEIILPIDVVKEENIEIGAVTTKKININEDISINEQEIKDVKRIETKEVGIRDGGEIKMNNRKLEIKNINIKENENKGEEIEFKVVEENEGEINEKTIVTIKNEGIDMNNKKIENVEEISVRRITSGEDDINITKTVNILGNLYVSGATTYVNTQDLNIKDHQIVIGDVPNPTDITAFNGGFILKGATDKTILYSNNNWNISENININENKEYKINNVSVLTKDTLGQEVINSSLKKVGILEELKVEGNVGIGIENPTEKLEILGNVKINGELDMLNNYLRNAKISGGILETSNIETDTATIKEKAIIEEEEVNKSTITTADITNMNVVEGVIGTGIITNAMITETTINEGIVTGTLTIEKAIIKDEEVETGKITNAEITNATITNANITEEVVERGTITNATITNAEITNETVDESIIINATIGTETVETSTIENATIGNVDITTKATINEIEVTNGGTIKDVTMTGITTIVKENVGETVITTAEITNAEITEGIIGNVEVTNNAIIKEATITEGATIQDMSVLGGAIINTANITNTNITNEATIKDANITNVATIKDANIINANITGEAIIEETTITKATITEADIGDTNILNTATVKDIIVTDTADITNTTLKGITTIIKENVTESTIADMEVTNSAVINEATITNKMTTNEAEVTTKTTTNELEVNSATTLNGETTIKEAEVTEKTTMRGETTIEGITTIGTITPGTSITTIINPNIAGLTTIEEEIVTKSNIGELETNQVKVTGEIDMRENKIINVNEIDVDNITSGNEKINIKKGVNITGETIINGNSVIIEGEKSGDNILKIKSKDDNELNIINNSKIEMYKEEEKVAEIGMNNKILEIKNKNMNEINKGEAIEFKVGGEKEGINYETTSLIIEDEGVNINNKKIKNVSEIDVERITTENKEKIEVNRNVEIYNDNSTERKIKFVDDEYGGLENIESGIKYKRGEIGNEKEGSYIGIYTKETTEGQGQGQEKERIKISYNGEVSLENNDMKNINELTAIKGTISAVNTSIINTGGINATGEINMNDNNIQNANIINTETINGTTGNITTLTTTTGNINTGNITTGNIETLTTTTGNITTGNITTLKIGKTLENGQEMGEINMNNRNINNANEINAETTNTETGNVTTLTTTTGNITTLNIGKTLENGQEIGEINMNNKNINNVNEINATSGNITTLTTTTGNITTLKIGETIENGQEIGEINMNNRNINNANIINTEITNTEIENVKRINVYDENNVKSGTIKGLMNDIYIEGENEILLYSGTEKIAEFNNTEIKLEKDVNMTNKNISNINTINATNGNITTVTSTTGNIETLNLTGNINMNQQNINNTGTITSENAVIKTGNVTKLNIISENEQEVAEIDMNNNNIKNVNEITTSTLSTTTGNIEKINIGLQGEIDMNNGEIKNVSTLTGTIGNIETITGTVGNIETITSTTTNATTVNATDINTTTMNATDINTTTVNATTINMTGDIDMKENKIINVNELDIDNITSGNEKININKGVNINGETTINTDNVIMDGNNPALRIKASDNDITNEAKIEMYKGEEKKAEIGTKGRVLEISNRLMKQDLSGGEDIEFKVGENEYETMALRITNEGIEMNNKNIKEVNEINAMKGTMNVLNVGPITIGDMNEPGNINMNNQNINNANEISTSSLTTSIANIETINMGFDAEINMNNGEIKNTAIMTTITANTTTTNATTVNTTDINASTVNASDINTSTMNASLINMTGDIDMKENKIVNVNEVDVDNITSGNEKININKGVNINGETIINTDNVIVDGDKPALKIKANDSDITNETKIEMYKGEEKTTEIGTKGRVLEISNKLVKQDLSGGESIEFKIGENEYESVPLRITNEEINMNKVKTTTGEITTLTTTTGNIETITGTVGNIETITSTTTNTTTINTTDINASTVNTSTANVSTMNASLINMTGDIDMKENKIANLNELDVDNITSGNEKININKGLNINGETTINTDNVMIDGINPALRIRASEITNEAKIEIYKGEVKTSEIGTNGRVLEISNKLVKTDLSGGEDIEFKVGENENETVPLRITNEGIELNNKNIKEVNEINTITTNTTTLNATEINTSIINTSTVNALTLNMTGDIDVKENKIMNVNELDVDNITSGNEKININKGINVTGETIINADNVIVEGGNTVLKIKTNDNDITNEAKIEMYKGVEKTTEIGTKGRVLEISNKLVKTDLSGGEDIEFKVGENEYETVPLRITNEGLELNNKNIKNVNEINAETGTINVLNVGSITIGDTSASGDIDLNGQNINNANEINTTTMTTTIGNINTLNIGVEGEINMNNGEIKNAAIVTTTTGNIGTADIGTADIEVADIGIGNITTVNATDINASTINMTGDIDMKENRIVNVNELDVDNITSGNNEININKNIVIKATNTTHPGIIFEDNNDEGNGIIRYSSTFNQFEILNKQKADLTTKPAKLVLREDDNEETNEGTGLYIESDIQNNNRARIGVVNGETVSNPIISYEINNEGNIEVNNKNISGINELVTNTGNITTATIGTGNVTTLTAGNTNITGDMEMNNKNINNVNKITTETGEIETLNVTNTNATGDINMNENNINNVGVINVDNITSNNNEINIDKTLLLKATNTTHPGIIFEDNNDEGYGILRYSGPYNQFELLNKELIGPEYKAARLVIREDNNALTTKGYGLYLESDIHDNNRARIGIVNGNPLNSETEPEPIISYEIKNTGDIEVNNKNINGINTLTTENIIVNNGVTIPAETITTENIQNEAVETTKIKDKNVTVEKLEDTLDLTSKIITMPTLTQELNINGGIRTGYVKSNNTELKLESNEENNAIIIKENGANKTVFYEVGDYEFKNNGLKAEQTKKMVIKASGNVGIGIDNPTEKLEVDGNIKITGNLTVLGTQTQINTQDLTVQDHQIVIGNVENPTNTTAASGGIVLKGTTDKTILWNNENWTMSENISVATGKEYKINNVSVLSATTLGDSVVNSSLESVGELIELTVLGNTSISGDLNMNQKDITNIKELTTETGNVTTLNVGTINAVDNMNMNNKNISNVNILDVDNITSSNNEIKYDTNIKIENENNSPFLDIYNNATTGEQKASIAIKSRIDSTKYELGTIQKVAQGLDENNNPIEVKMGNNFYIKREGITNEDIVINETGKIGIHGEIDENNDISINGTTIIKERLNMNNKNITNVNTLTTLTGNVTTLNADTINSTSIITTNINTTTEYKINNETVITGTTLGTNVVNSSLTSVGTLTGLTVGGATSLLSNVDINNNDIINVKKVRASITQELILEDETGDQSIYIRENNEPITSFYQSGGTYAAGEGYLFYMGGTKSNQTLRFQISTDKIGLFREADMNNNNLINVNETNVNQINIGQIRHKKNGNLAASVGALEFLTDGTGYGYEIIRGTNTYLRIGDNGNIGINTTNQYGTDKVLINGNVGIIGELNVNNNNINNVNTIDAQELEVVNITSANNEINITKPINVTVGNSKFTGDTIINSIVLKEAPEISYIKYDETNKMHLVTPDIMKLQKNGTTKIEIGDNVEIKNGILNMNNNNISNVNQINVNNKIVIDNGTANSFAKIEVINDNDKQFHLGIGGSTVLGEYQDNPYLYSSDPNKKIYTNVGMKIDGELDMNNKNISNVNTINTGILNMTGNINMNNNNITNVNTISGETINMTGNLDMNDNDIRNVTNIFIKNIGHISNNAGPLITISGDNGGTIKLESSQIRHRKITDTATRDATIINPEAGTVIFNESENKMQYYNNVEWRNIGGLDNDENLNMNANDIENINTIEINNITSTNNVINVNKQILLNGNLDINNNNITNVNNMNVSGTSNVNNMNVSGTANISALINMGDDATFGRDFYIFNAETYTEINRQTNHPINILTNNIGRITIGNDGNIGIGTSTPSTKLEVNGKIKGTKLDILGDSPSVLIQETNTAATGVSYGILSIEGASQYGVNIKGYIEQNVGSGGIIEVNNGGVIQEIMRMTSNKTVTFNTNEFTLNAGNSGDCVLKMKADNDNNNELDNPRIEMYQDGDFLAASIGMNNNTLEIKNKNAKIEFYLNEGVNEKNILTIQESGINMNSKNILNVNTIWGDSPLPLSINANESQQIIIREDSLERTSFYQYGGLYENEAGYIFYTGGLKSEQTKKVQISDDKTGIYNELTMNNNNITNVNQINVNNKIVIDNGTSNSFAKIDLINDNDKEFHMGIGGSTVLGEYQDNPYLYSTDTSKKIYTNVGMKIDGELDMNNKNITNVNEINTSVLKINNPDITGSNNGKVGIKGRMMIQALDNIDTSAVLELKNNAGTISYIYNDNAGNINVGSNSNIILFNDNTLTNISNIYTDKMIISPEVGNKAILEFREGNNVKSSMYYNPASGGMYYESANEDIPIIYKFGTTGVVEPVRINKYGISVGNVNGDHADVNYVFKLGGEFDAKNNNISNVNTIDVDNITSTNNVININKQILLNGNLDINNNNITNISSLTINGGDSLILQDKDEINKRHGYISYYNINNVRKGYIGYPGDGISAMQIVNEITDADIKYYTTGEGRHWFKGNVLIGDTAEENDLQVIGTTNLVGNVGINGEMNMTNNNITNVNTIDVDNITTTNNVININKPIEIINATPTSDTALNDPEEVLKLIRYGTFDQSHNAAASLRLSRYEIGGAGNDGSRTRLDLVLAHDVYMENATTALTALSNGNIGIGTTTPATKLDIAGITTIRTPGSFSITIDPNTGGPYIDMGGMLKIGAYENHNIFDNATGTRDYVFRHNGNERMRIKSDGNVGIGTSNPETKLQIGTSIIDDGNYVYDNNSMYIVHQSPTSSTVLNDPKEVLLLGRQGTSEEAYGAAASFRLSRYENAGVLSRTRLDLVLTHNEFMTNATTALTALSNGNVGIGTTAPSEKLEVNGNIKCGGIYYDGSTIYKKIYRVAVSKHELYNTESNTTLYKMGTINYEARPVPTGYYSIVYCKIKYAKNYMTGAGTDAVTFQLRGVQTDGYNSASDDGNNWLLDEQFGYWLNASGAGARFSPGDTLQGGIRYNGGAENEHVFMLYGKRSITTRSTINNHIKDPEENTMTAANGWQIDTTYTGGPVYSDDNVRIGFYMQVEIEQVIYANP